MRKYNLNSLEFHRSSSLLMIFRSIVLAGLQAKKATAIAMKNMTNR